MKSIQDDPFLSNSNWEVVRQYVDLNTLFQVGTPPQAPSRRPLPAL